jgi:biofilm PGA synthesis N-glycosyltransferase PgaC
VLFREYLRIFAEAEPYFSHTNKASMAEILCWISLGILFYCYIGYGVFVFLLNNIRVLFAATPKGSFGELPSVTLIISAYNEEKVLEQKIQNTLSLDYPKDKLYLFFVTDGSNDDSVQLLKRYPGIQLLHDPVRKGKYAAIKRAMKHVQTTIVAFSDANCMLNAECLQKMLVHYSDPGVGGVAGEKKILRNNYASVVGEAEGMYWQYESFLKKMDAELHTVVGASGELFSIRSSLFQELNDDVILDDFVISMQVCLQGYRIEYEPDAFATELPSASLAEEEKRKVRISAGAYQSIGYLRECLNIFKHPVLAFQFISRRFLRWVLCPLLLFVLLVSNIIVVISPHHPLYNSLLLLQTIFYAFAFLGWLFVKSGKRAGLFTIPFYFSFMNYCLIKGVFRFASGRQTVLWEKSLRQAVE